MRPRQEASEEQLQELALAMRQETRKMQRRRLQCVWLRVKHDMSTEAVAQATGFCVSQVWRIWSQYFRGSVSALRKSKGGRRNQRMTAQEEAKFLETHLARARQGWVLTARKIKESYEKQVGRKVPDSTVCRMLKRHHWRKVSTRPTHPRGDPAAREEFKKKLGQKVAAVRLAKPGLELLLMFEDEARFGRMSRPLTCWAPLGTRPEVKTQMVREYDYAFGAVAPLTGQMDSLVLPRCDTEMMRIFLAEVSQRHLDRHVLMFMDQAGWHTTKKLRLPNNITIDFLPPRSPQCNPQEPVWKVLRRDILGNRHFNSLAEVSKATAAGLHALENNQTFLQGLCGFDWIITSLLNAS